MMPLPALGSLFGGGFPVAVARLIADRPDTLTCDEFLHEYLHHAAQRARLGQFALDQLRPAAQAEGAEAVAELEATFARAVALEQQAAACISYAKERTR